MQIDLRGKIREKKLATNKVLLPLFEAVVNSIQAIEEGSATKPGIIEISMRRVPQGSLGMSDVELIGNKARHSGASMQQWLCSLAYLCFT